MLINFKDVFEIDRRLREIDENYYIVFNSFKKRFEVHNSAQKGNTLSVVVPFDYPDERTVTLINKTRIENKDSLLKEIERENEKTEKRKIREMSYKLRVES